MLIPIIFKLLDFSLYPLDIRPVKVPHKQEITILTKKIIICVKILQSFINKKQRKKTNTINTKSIIFLIIKFNPLILMDLFYHKPC